MTDGRPVHERALELAVSALDFELEPNERAWLDAHLDGCPACRHAAHSYSYDARRLEQLPLVSAPERVEARILGAARDRPSGPSGSLRLMALATAVVFVFAIGGLALLQSRPPQAGSAASAAPSTAVSTGASTAGLGPSTATLPPGRSSADASTATPDPTRLQVGSPLGWRSVEVPGDEVRDIRSTLVRDRRAIATLVGVDGEPLLWWSDDGGPWRDAELPAGAFGGTAPWLVEPFANGFVALGWTDLARSATERRIWLSPDGLAWRPDVDETGTLGSLTHGVLAASDEGVLVAGRSANGEMLAWRSADGLAWGPVTVDEEIRQARLSGLVSDGAAFFAWADVDGSPAIWRSEDGAAWTALPTPPGLTRLEGLLATRGGLVAHGATADGPANRLFWSTDGAGWAAVEIARVPGAAEDAMLTAAGSPDGLIAVWRLGDGRTVYGESSDGWSWTVRDAVGLPDGVELEHVDRVGSVLIGLGHATDGQVVAISASLED